MIASDKRFSHQAGAARTRSLATASSTWGSESWRPNHHWTGFDRGSTKPPWYDEARRNQGFANTGKTGVTLTALDRFEANAVGRPRAVPLANWAQLPPFAQERDSQPSSWAPQEGFVDMTMTRQSESDWNRGKFSAYTSASQHSHFSRMQNHHDAQKGEGARTLIIGDRNRAKDDFLFPMDVVNGGIPVHRQALELEKK